MSITVTFSDSSTPGPSGPITSWSWDFGDGGTSTSQNPTHNYAAAGNYTVRLVVTGSGNDGTASISKSITVYDPVVNTLNANFVFSANNLVVSFTDQSNPGPSGPITGWSWDFGDSNTSTSQNPTHTYSSAGTYTVVLTITGTSPDGTDNVSHSVTVTAAPTGAAYPKVASVNQNTGETWSQAAIRTLGYGYNGVVYYSPSGTPTAWNSQLAALAAAKGSYPLNLQLTCKTHDDTGLNAVLTNLPDAWRPGFKYNIFQEPEDNLTTTSARDGYKANYHSAANVIRAWNSAHPTKAVDLPWLELQEWTLDPANSASWNSPPGESLLALFKPADADYEGVLWSLFEYGQSSGGIQKAPPNDRIVAQVGRVTSAMTDVFPGKPFALMASAYTLEGTIGDAQLKAQSDWLSKLYTTWQNAGASGFAWYNVNFPGTGGASGEGRIELNHYIMAYFASLNGGSSSGGGSGSVYWGARMEGAFYNTNYSSGTSTDPPFTGSGANQDLFESHAGKALTAVHWGGSFGSITAFSTSANSNARSRGQFSMVSMAPSRQQVLDLANNTNANGTLTAIDNWATAVAGQNYPILFRPLWEMNGSWNYPWQNIGTSGVTQSQYIAAWRTLYNRVNAIAHCVSFFWVPNVISSTVPDPTPWFPGTAYVDWVGMDGYQQGDTKSPSQIFGQTLGVLQGLAPGKPIGISETGCKAPTSYTGGKSKWITDFFAWLAANPSVKFFSWFNYNTSPPLTYIEVGNASTTFDGEAETAFQNGVADSRYIDNIVNSTTFPSGQKVPIP